MAAENFKVKKGLEVGTGATITSEGVNVTGIITATQFKGDGSGLTNVVGSGSGIVVKDEGSAVGTAGTINFVGSGVVASLAAGQATVTISSGGLNDVVDDTTPQLGGGLDLNSKFITGSGGINVTGVVTATTLKGAIEATTASFSGAIDANGDLDVDGHTELDNLNVAGVTTATTIIATTGLEPDTDNGAYLGTNAKSWSSLFVDNIGVDGNVIQALSGNLDLNSSSGSVVLKHGGNQKLTTTINGIEVPDLNVTGVGTVGRLDTSGVTLGTNSTTFAAKFADDAVANFGTDNDMKVLHTGSNGNINNYTGDLVIRTLGSGDDVLIDSEDDILLRTNSTFNSISCVGGEGVELYHYSGSGVTSTKRIETTKHGAIVTGVCTATSFSGDGSALTGITAAGSGIIVKHDGSTVGTAGTINFSTNLDVTPISAGIVTVTSSGGGVSLANGVDNRVVTATGAAALNGETNLTWDGTTLGVTGNQTVSQSVVVGTGVTLNARGINAVGTGITAGRFHADGGSFQAQIGATNQGFYLFNGNSTHLGISWSSSASINQFRGNASGSNPLIIDDFSYISINAKSNFVRLQHAESTKLITDQAGVKITGVCTATTFSGSGASLTTLNADELDSGTIPNGRFPATLPATSGVNLTALNASEITSGTLPIARITDGAVTFAKMQDVGTGVLIGRNNSGSGDMETLSASEVRTLLNVADGATAGITTAAWTVGHSGASYYTFTGPGGLSNTQNADLHLIRGQTYQFIVNATNHGFGIQTVSGSWSSGNEYTTGITNPRADSGTITFRVPYSAPGRLYYACTSSHSGMVGNIYISGGGGVVTYEGAKELQLGNTTGTSVNTANLVNLNLGGTYHDTAGTAGKLKLYDDGNDEISLGVSNNSCDFILTSGSWGYNFYGGNSGATRLMSLNQIAGGSIVLGTESSAGVTAPLSINLGGTYSDADGNGNNLSAKLKLWTDGNNLMGLSVSDSQLDYIVTEASYDHVFYGGSAGTSELARFTGDGNFGIGTNNPSTALEVKGDITVYNSNNQGDIFFGEHGDVADSKALIRMDQISGTAGELQFHTESGGTLTKRLTISSDGTTTFDPSAGGTLKIGGSSAHTSKIVIADNGGTANGNCLVEGGDGTDFFTIQSSGNVAFENGKGINFGATEGSGATTSVLDDYEEGTFQPTLSGGSSSQVMYYTKIGRVVHISGSLSFSSISGSGNMAIGGLPYTSINGNDSYTHLAAHAYDSLNVGNNTYQFQTLRVDQNSTTIRIIIPAGNGDIRTFGQYSHVSNSTFRFRVAGYYITA